MDCATTRHQEVCSEFCQGPTTTVVWHIKGWDNQNENDFKLLRVNSSCIVDVAGAGGAPGVGHPPKARLRFYFPEKLEYEVVDRADAGEDVTSAYYECVAMVADELFNSGSKILQYDIKVDFLDDDKLDPDEYKSVKISRAEFYDDDDTKRRITWVSDKLIRLTKNVTPRGGQYSKTTLARPPDLRLKISVTPIYISEEKISSLGDADKLQKPEGEASMLHSLKGMFSAEENYSDLNLETKDNLILSAHKFILAARSPVLRDLIEDHAKENDWNGTIKLPDVNVKAMTVILHWIYCGEVHDQMVKCVDEVLEAAGKFRLTELIKLLDKKLLLSCNKENMFQMYQVAQKNGMVTAIQEIAKFIKENI